MSNFDKIISQHERIALQFSGGRDSLACIFLLREFWDKLTVYWCDAGAAYPETVSVIAKICEMVPNFAIVKGAQPETIEKFGVPTDILPASQTPMGIVLAGKGTPMQDRYSCCLRSKIIPMHARMIADGITLIIRGQKDADYIKGPLHSGAVDDAGVEYLYPIEGWSNSQVMKYLREQGAPIPRFYEMLETTPDCMNCTAFWEEGVAKYQKRYHHEQYIENQEKLGLINQAVSEHIAAFNKEVAA